MISLRSRDDGGESTPPPKRRRGSLLGDFRESEAPEEKEEDNADNPGGGDLVTQDAGDGVPFDSSPSKNSVDVPKDAAPIEDEKKDDSDVQRDLISAVQNAGLEVSVRVPSAVVEGLDEEKSD